ncbi:hypothetical protein, partial [Xanthomonas translucens]|uniref:hypothetical protein n=5 Tax=Xanthomonas campestris pv. translucens TaxID=343 RepID=UPI001C401388
DRRRRHAAAGACRCAAGGVFACAPAARQARRFLRCQAHVARRCDSACLRIETNARISASSGMAATHISLRPMAAIARRDKLIVPRK